MKKTFNIGKIVNTQGLKGQVRVYPYTNYKERFEELDCVYLDKDLNQKLEIESVGYKKNMVILKFKGLNNIEAVERLKETDLFIDRDAQGQELEEGEFFIVDLIGLKVIDDQFGEIGILKDVYQNTAQDLYVVKRPKGSDLMIPYVDAFIREINIEEGVIRTTLWEGMLE